MHQTDYGEFKAVMNDLCVAGNVPLTDDRLRVFWEALRDHPWGLIRANMRRWISSGDKFPRPAELKPAAQKNSGGITQGDIANKLVDFAVSKYFHQLTPNQRRVVTIKYRGNPYTGENHCVTAVEFPADGEHAGLRVSIDDMQMDAACA